MKIKVLLAAIICLNTSIKAQTTYVPDDNFEQYLIDIGLDSGPLDDYVLTESIDTLTDLESHYFTVQNLTGIEDFIALEYLHLVDPLFSVLDLSNNPNLNYLYIENNNNLSTINITQNLRLKHLVLITSNLETVDISQNDSLIDLTLMNHQNMDSINTSNNLQLESLNTGWLNVYFDVTNNLELKHISFKGTVDYPTRDLSQNTKLESVDAPCGKLDSLDLSHNTLLNHVNIYCNELTYLNLQNGNNINILDTDFKINSNPNLTCVLVDNENFSTQNWFEIDPQSYFSNSCITGIEKDETIVMSISPNPMTSFVNITVSQESTYFITSIDGKQVKEGVLYPGKNYMNMTDLNTGIYIINVKAFNNVQTYKIIKD